MFIKRKIIFGVTGSSIVDQVLNTTAISLDSLGHKLVFGNPTIKNSQDEIVGKVSSYKYVGDQTKWKN